MRTGVPTLHQALTPEAATILKLSLSLAQRRNHAQVTPLHVATTLLTSSTSPSLCTPSNLLKRACLKSQQQPSYQNTLLHCRALELCFNVALNRLPTCTSPSSSSTTNGATTNPNPNSLMHASYPTLSNALIAALKRAQANQRRGCIELQQQQNQLQQNQSQNQNQQPLLAIKVELEQLIISILDDPSVSRVMREAGFSSSLVKSSLEEEREKECSVLSLGHNKDLWQTQFIKPIFDQDPLGVLPQKEDVRLIFEVMGRKMQERKRNNPILVGDSVCLTENLVEEVRRRLERGDVPEELKEVQFVKFGISTYMQLGLVGKGGIELKVEELKRNLGSSNGVVVYIGDLKWALGDEIKGELDSGFSPIGYIADEIEKLVCGSNGGKVWVLGIASYQTYMQVKRRRPSLEIKWGLHAVTVPCGGLSLSLQAPAQNGLEPRVTRQNQSSFQLFEAPQKVYFAPKEGEEERAMLCFECNAYYEREASIILNSDARRTGGIQLPSWLRPISPNAHHKGNLMELRSKWSRLCQKLHQFKNNNSHFYPSLLGSNFSPKKLNLLHPIWGHCNQNKPILEQHPAPFQTSCPKNYPLEIARDKETKTTNSTTNIFLGGLFNLSDSASSESKERRRRRSFAEVQELEKRLHENIPWQEGAISSIVEAFEKKENLILLEGSDEVAKRRVALVIAEIYCGSADKVFRVNPSKFDLEIVSKELEKEKRCVVLIEDINQAPADFLNLVRPLKEQAEAIIILTISQSEGMLKSKFSRESYGVMNMRFLVESRIDNDLKRKSPSQNELEKEPKRPRGETGLDLNLCANEDEGEVAFDEEEAVPSDITHEGEGFDQKTDLPQTLFQKFGSGITISMGSNSFVRISNRIVARLNRACTEIWGEEEEQFGNLDVDKEVVEWLVWASGSCLEALFEKWVREVFQTCVPTVKKGGKVRLGLGVGAIGGGIEGREGIVPGFCGSVLPEKIHLD